MSREIMVPIANEMAEEIRATITMNECNKRKKIREEADKAAEKAGARKIVEKPSSVLMPFSDVGNTTTDIENSVGKSGDTVSSINAPPTKPCDGNVDGGVVSGVVGGVQNTFAAVGGVAAVASNVAASASGKSGGVVDITPEGAAVADVAPNIAVNPAGQPNNEAAGHLMAEKKQSVFKLINNSDKDVLHNDDDNDDDEFELIFDEID